MTNTIHAHLLDLGFTFTEVDADWHDSFEDEIGYHLSGGPAYCKYESDVLGLCITVEECGRVCVEEHFA
mgnify:CR=1 FL=1